MFPGLDLEPRKLSDFPLRVTCDAEAPQNTISLSALSHLWEISERERLLQRLSSGSLIYVLLGWRLTQRPFSVLETRHLVVQDGGDNAPNNCPVIFNRDLSWAKRITDNHKELIRVQEEEAARDAAALRFSPFQTPFPFPHTCQFCRPTTITNIQPLDWRQRRRQATKQAFCERRALQHLRLHLPDTISTTNKKKNNNSTQTGSLAQCHNLMETFQHYAERVFRETGDTKELLQLTHWAQQLAESRLNRTNRTLQGRGSSQLTRWAER